MVKLKPTAQAGEGQSAIPAAMEAFQGLADLWQLSTEDQLLLLGAPGLSTFFKWKKDGGSLPRDTVERISHLLAIHKALEILLPETRAADGWIRRPNAQDVYKRQDEGSAGAAIETIFFQSDTNSCVNEGYLQPKQSLGYLTA